MKASQPSPPPRAACQLESQAPLTTAGQPSDSRAAAGVPRGYWNFSWVAEDNLSFRDGSMPKSVDPRCPGHSRTCDYQPDDPHEFTWSIVAAGDLREERNGKNEKMAGSPQGWEEAYTVPGQVERMD
ncbi:hypothetical protein FQA47_010392 [Oryzias melastigma]|uniref:Uncharacterized protein n=1 Tax=Oryzias melastigma TaxID=30732 RepID=A0A834FF16_ORYME|nr:hypothetical protein FQA47_010392 [Oryzias melastigma]